MKTLKILCLLLGTVVIAAPAFAVTTTETTTETWNTTNGGNTLSAGSGTSCGLAANGATQACAFSTMGSVVNTGNGTPIAATSMTAKAYSTQTPAALNTTASISLNWVQAQIAVYGNNGIGISNVKQTATDDLITPQHAIDNSQIHDVLVLDLGSAGWDTVSFSLGYICAINSTGNGCTSNSTPFTVQAWMGGSTLGGGFDFTKMCFTGCSDTSFNLLQPTAGGKGFTEVTSTLSAPAGDTVAMTGGQLGSTVATFTGVDTTVTIGSQPNVTLGQYLIITPGLSDSLSSFKFSGFVASKTVTTTTTQGAPVPGSLPLLALGLLALTFGRRRFAPNA